MSREEGLEDCSGCYPLLGLPKLCGVGASEKSGSGEEGVRREKAILAGWSCIDQEVYEGVRAAELG